MQSQQEGYIQRSMFPQGHHQGKGTGFERGDQQNTLWEKDLKGQLQEGGGNGAGLEAQTLAMQTLPLGTEVSTGSS